MSDGSTDKEPAAGLCLGTVTLGDKLAAGPNGSCFRGIDHVGNDVFVRASRVVPPDGFAASCGAEAEYAALFECEGASTPTPIDLIYRGDYAYSVSSWVPGVPLNQVRDLDLDRVSRALIEAVARCHRLGWTHGDVKPGNILVTSAHDAVLIDWETARRVGSRALPGTLGYAPPTAWDAGHVAKPANDSYSLAVTLLEALEQRRAFQGDRREIIGAQATHRLATTRKCPRVIELLFDAANAGRDLQDVLDTILDESAPQVSTEYVVRALHRREASRLSQRVANTVKANGAVARTSIAINQMCDQDRFAHAIAGMVRINHGLNSVCLSALIGGVPSSPTDSVQELRGSRVDAIRDRRRRSVAHVIKTLEQLSPVLVVGAENEAADYFDILAHELNDPESDAKSAAPVLLVQLNTEVAGANTTNDRKDTIRAIVERVFVTSAIGDEVLVQLENRCLGPYTAVVDEIMRIIAADGLVRRDGSIRWCGALQDSRPAKIDLDLVESDSPDAASLERPADVGVLLAVGEEAAARGRGNDVIRTCIRAHTALHEKKEFPWILAERLADLWSECGRADAAEAVLNSVSDGSGEVQAKRLVSLGRTLASKGSLDRLGEIVTKAAEMDLTIDQRVEMYRLEALSLIPIRKFIAGYDLLRTALGSARKVDTRTLLWLLNSLGNILRLAGRQASARRTLRLARRLACALGSVRGQVVAAGNLLLASEGELPVSQMAKESWRIAVNCFYWGMVADGMAYGLVAATRWLDCRDPSRALMAIERARLVSRTWPGTSRVYSCAISEVWLATTDLIEDWDRLEEVAFLATEHESGPVFEIHRRLLRSEMGLSYSEGAQPGSMVLNARTDKALRVLMRSVEREGGTKRRRVWAALNALIGNIEPFFPVTGHAARRLAFSIESDEGVEVTLDAARVACERNSEALPMALALHALVHVWRDSVSRPTSQWLIDHSSASITTRPAGVRAWEWRFAHASAAIATGMTDPVELDLDPCLQELEAQLQRMTSRLRAAYIAQLPYARFVGLAGASEGCEAWISRTGPSEMWRLDSLRAHLHRAKTTNGAARSRAAGLERVLGSALCLRASMDIDMLLGEVVSGVLVICRAERAVAIYDSGDGRARSKIGTPEGVRDIDAGAAEISLSILERVRREGRACLFDDACGEEGLNGRPSVVQFRPRSLVVAPFRTEGVFRGYVYVENRSAAKSFSQSDLELVEGFAAQAELALENARLVAQLRASCHELETARGEAVRSESLRVMGRMASEVAHDFNNLLTAILGEAQLLLLDPSLAEHDMSLRIIERAALDGAAVIRKIQDSTRIRTDKDFELLALEDIVARVTETIRLRVADAGVELVCEVQPKLLVRGVAAELREVLTNIAINGLEAMREGGRLCIRTGTEEGFVCVDIEDSGCGMSPEVVSKVFDPFFSTKGAKGNGLGLSIAYGIVRRHGGNILIKSAPGAGTRMSVRLPAVAGDIVIPSSRELRVRHASAAHGRAFGRTRVLIVDDDRDVARVLIQMLEHLGADVEVVYSGQEAVARLEAPTLPLDLVITDFHMPGMDGFEVVKAARKSLDRSRVVLMSGSLSGEEAAVRGDPGLRLLLKPFTLQDVERLLGEQL